MATETSQSQPRRLDELITGNDLFTQALPPDPLTPLIASDGDRPPLAPPSGKPTLLASREAGAAALSQLASRAGLVEPPSDNAPSRHDLEVVAKAAEALRQKQRNIRSSRQVHGMFTFIDPEPIQSPCYLAFSRDTARLLDIVDDDPELIDIFSGKRKPEHARPYAHNYGGHQYGYYAGQLGDGRCISLGDVVAPTIIPTGKTEKEIQSDPALSSPTTRWEIQIKGAGKTPYSRHGDGMCSLKGSTREFLGTEYLHALGVPTIRSLAMIGTNKAVYRDKGMESSATLIRIAPTWIRFGSFELNWYRGEKSKVKVLADFVIDNYMPWLKNTENGEQIEVIAGSGGGASRRAFQAAVEGLKTVNEENAEDTNPLALALQFPKVDGEIPEKEHLQVNTRPSLRVKEERDTAGEVTAYVVAPYAPGTKVEVALNKYAKFLREVIKRTANLIAHWQVVGFCHGVLNTDNMSVLGLTMDLGPFTFLDSYDPFKTGNRSDDVGRYRFEHQPKIALWNLSKFSRTLVELIRDETDDREESPNLDSLDIIKQLLDDFEPMFVEKYTDLMRKKLGFRMVKENDLDAIILPLLQLLADVGADYPTFFRRLCYFRTTDDGFHAEIGPLVTPPEGFELSEEDRHHLLNAAITPTASASQAKPLTPQAGSQASRSPGTAPTPLIRNSGVLDHLLESLQKLEAEVKEEEAKYKVEMDEAEKALQLALAATEIIEEDAESSNGSFASNPSTAVGSRGGSAKRNKQSKSIEKAANQNEKEAQAQNDQVELNEPEDPFSDSLPTENEIRFRFQCWARTYRSRLLLERAATRSIENMDVEDRTRSEWMRKRNPLFSLRSWILHETVAELAALPHLLPRDLEMERMEFDAQEAARIAEERAAAANVLRDAGRANMKIPPKPKIFVAPAEEEPAGGRHPHSAEAIDRVMRIVIGDIWGDRTDANAWEDEADAATAADWSYLPPDWARDLMESSAS